MAWGEGSIITHISTVQRGRLIYRDEDAARFSASATLEDTARLLRNCEDDVNIPVPADHCADDLWNGR